MQKLLVWRLNNGFTMADFFQYLVHFLGPRKGFWILIVDLNEFFDGSDEFRNASEHTSSNPLAGDFSEPAFDQVEPRGTGRGKVQVKARMFFEPPFDVRMFVRPIVVQDQMEIQSSGHLPVNLAQELEKLFVPMAGITGTNHRTVQDIERGEQTRGSVALVIMGHRSTATLFHGQSGLCAVQGLDLGLLVYAKHHGLVRWVQIQSHDIGELLDELLISGQFESFHAVRLQAVRIPNPRDCGMTDSEFFGQRSRTPMGRIGGCGMQGSLYDFLDLGCMQTLGAGAVGCIFRQAPGALFFESIAPENNGGPGGSQLTGNRIVGFSIGGEQTDARAQDHTLRCRPGTHPGFQGSSLFGRNHESIGWFPHNPVCITGSGYCQDITETLH